MSEKRYIPGTVSLRVAEGKSPFVVGRAVVYNSWSEPIYNSFRERLAPGCFDASLAIRDRDVIATVDHDYTKLLGRLASGTLRLDATKEAIDAEVPLPDITYARDLAESVRRGDIRGMSFTFDVLEDLWARNGDMAERTVVKADLWEVSWVVFPAYPASSAGMRTRPDDDGMAVLARMRAALVAPEHDRMRKRLELAEKS